VTDDVARLQNGLDDVERTLSLQGYAPLFVAGTAFALVLRGGLESVILVSSILGYLAAARASHMRTAVYAGVACALGATVATWFVFQGLLRIAPVRPSLVEAIPALLAVIVLIVFAYWLLARLDRHRWLEFMSARVFTAVAAGSVAAMFGLGFTAVYRQGFESVAFFQALLAYSKGLEAYLVAGTILASLALAGLSFLMFRLGRRIPVTAFLAISIALVMIISVSFLGNAVRGLQEAYVIPITNLTGSLPRLPFYLAQTTGYHPTLETIVAQVLLILAYLVTGIWVVVVARRRRAAARARSVSATVAVARSGARSGAA
jgi:high-affinity iron transporter